MSAEPLPSRLTFPLRPIQARADLRSRRVPLPRYLPARMLNEFTYCPRLFFYEWVEGVFAHSADTIEGALRHETLGQKAEALAPAGESGEERVHARSVSLSSDRYGLTAVIDLLEGEGDRVSPVDYKRGAPRDDDGVLAAWPTDRVQVCVQALILREHGYTCDEGVIYYNQTKQRVRVPIDEANVAATLAAVDSARAVAESGHIPPPLVASPKCVRCSLAGICLPDETRALLTGDGVNDDRAPEQLALFHRPEDGATGSKGSDVKDVRRLIPAGDDLRPLYVTGYGFSVGRSGGVLEVREKKAVIQEARLNDVSQVNIFGSASVTSGAVQALAERDRPIAYFTTGGWFYGMTTPLGLKNVFLRREQFRRADDEAFCASVARAIVATKIRNQRTMLQRNHVEPPARAVEALKRLATQAMVTADLESLLGVEGTAAHYYFGHFGGMIKADEADRPSFDFTHRNRRPPRDPVNALLSLGYSLLVRDLTFVCHTIGFDPFIGFYHQPRFGRPALPLDLMEGFRPLIVDSTVLFAINTAMVTADDFQRVGESCTLTARGRKRFLRAYEQRMDTQVTHPLFGYRVSYRRVLEIQTRLLARVVTGELPAYPGFETR